MPLPDRAAARRLLVLFLLQIEQGLVHQFAVLCSRNRDRAFTRSFCCGKGPHSVSPGYTSAMGAALYDPAPAASSCQRGSELSVWTPATRTAEDLQLRRIECGPHRAAPATTAAGPGCLASSGLVFWKSQLLSLQGTHSSAGEGMRPSKTCASVGGGGPGLSRNPASIVRASPVTPVARPVTPSRTPFSVSVITWLGSQRQSQT